jgi:hypothetical protein
MILLFLSPIIIPRSKITGRFRQESTGNRWNVEAVFPPENFRIFSDDFRPVAAGKHRKSTGIHRKKSNKFPVGILLPLPMISGAFLRDPATSPLLSCRIRRDPVAVIIDLGYYYYAFFLKTKDTNDANQNS